MVTKSNGQPEIIGGITSTEDGSAVTAGAHQGAVDYLCWWRLARLDTISTTPSFPDCGMDWKISRYCMCREKSQPPRAYSLVAYLSQSTIDHASLSRRSTVLTPTRDTSNIGALITYITQQFLAYLIGGLNGIAQGAPRGHGIDDKGVRRLFQRPCLVVPRLGRNLSSVKQAARNGVVSILDMNNLRLQANKFAFPLQEMGHDLCTCLLYTSPSPRD